MAIEITTCRTPEEFAQAVAPIFHYFGGPVAPEDLEPMTRVFEVDRTIMARDGGEVLGGAGAHTYELTVPGGLVPAAGVTVVGVLPTARRRGILRAMMRAQLDDFYARREPVAYLWASEETIYGRFGYGMASLTGEFELPKSDCVFARPSEPRGELRFVTEEESYEPIAEVYDRIRRDYPGMFSRKEHWWKSRRLADPVNRRRGGGVLNRVVLHLGGKPEGYALYRVHQNLANGITTGYISVLEALGTSPEAMRELWRFLLSIDWVASVKGSCLPIDHPLFFLLARPRRMRMTLGDALWVRLVDVKAALRARSFQAGDAVVIEVADSFCAWNAGRYSISASGVERTTAAADLAVDVEAMGSVYLGGFSFAQLLRAGRVVEQKPGAAHRADQVFRTDRAPWCPEIF